MTISWEGLSEPQKCSLAFMASMAGQLVEVEARRISRHHPTLRETRLLAELAAGPYVGREFTILRALREIRREAGR